MAKRLSERVTVGGRRSSGCEELVVLLDGQPFEPPAAVAERWKELDSDERCLLVIQLLRRAELERRPGPPDEPAYKEGQPLDEQLAEAEAKLEAEQAWVPEPPWTEANKAERVAEAESVVTYCRERLSRAAAKHAAKAAR